MRRAVMISLVAGLSACGKPAVDKADGPTIPQVRTAVIGGDSEASMVVGVGTVALRREAALGFTSAGRIARITVNEGEKVRRGQVLAALDTTTVQADLARAVAERERAAAEYRRSASLMEQGWITRPRLESAKASLQAAEATVAQTRFQATNATIVAPGNGTVLARLAEPGQVVAAGAAVLNIGEEASGYVLRVPLSDRDAARIVMGAGARVTLAPLEGVTLNGHVIELGGRADRSTGTFIAEIALPDDPRLRSGQIGDVSITASGATVTQIRAPASAIFAARAGTAFVYVVDQSRKKVRLRQVSIADTTDGGIRITGGLARGDVVATSRIDRLKDGLTIAPIGPGK